MVTSGRQMIKCLCVFIVYFHLYLFDPKTSPLCQTTGLIISFSTHSFISSCKNYFILNKFYVGSSCLFFSVICFLSVFLFALISMFLMSLQIILGYSDLQMFFSLPHRHQLDEPRSQRGHRFVASCNSVKVMNEETKGKACQKVC